MDRSKNNRLFCFKEMNTNLKNNQYFQLVFRIQLRFDRIKNENPFHCQIFYNSNNTYHIFMCFL